MYGSLKGGFNAEWKMQSFVFNNLPGLEYGFVQHKVGPLHIHTHTHTHTHARTNTASHACKHPTDLRACTREDRAECWRVCKGMW